MEWHFVDTEGREGWVREDLSLVYFGEQNILTTIEHYATELGSEPPLTDEAMQTLMVEVYADGAVRLAERSESETELQ